MQQSIRLPELCQAACLSVCLSTHMTVCTCLLCLPTTSACFGVKAKLLSVLCQDHQQAYKQSPEESWHWLKKHCRQCSVCSMLQGRSYCCLQGAETSSEHTGAAQNNKGVEWKSTADSAPKNPSLSKESIVPQRPQAVHDQPETNDPHDKGKLSSLSIHTTHLCLPARLAGRSHQLSMADRVMVLRL